MKQVYFYGTIPNYENKKKFSNKKKTKKDHSRYMKHSLQNYVIFSLYIRL